MIIESSTVCGVKCRLTLPRFKEENTAEIHRVENMNLFIKRFSAEAEKFSASSRDVRRYCTNYTVSDQNGNFTVIIHISARKISDLGASTTVKRDVCVTWHGTRLISCKISGK